MSWQPLTNHPEAAFLWHALMLSGTQSPVSFIAGNASLAPRAGHAANASAPASVHTDELAAASQAPAPLSSIQVPPAPRQASTAALFVPAPAPAPVLAQIASLASTSQLLHGTAGSATSPAGTQLEFSPLPMLSQSVLLRADVS